MCLVVSKRWNWSVRLWLYYVKIIYKVHLDSFIQIPPHAFSAVIYQQIIKYYCVFSLCLFSVKITGILECR